MYQYHRSGSVFRAGRQTGRRNEAGDLSRWSVAAVFGLTAAAMTTAVTLADPPREPCKDNAVHVQVPGLMPRTSGNMCEPLGELSPDPCAAGWSNVGSASEPTWASSEPAATSACWNKVRESFMSVCASLGDDRWTFAEVYGYPLNIALNGGPSLGDFLPPSPTLGGSSVALLPPGTGAMPTGWGGLERPVHEGAVDLITGMPLARIGELELPFAGATFRLIRTRSQAFRGSSACACPDLDMW